MIKRGVITIKGQYLLIAGIFLALIHCILKEYANAKVITQYTSVISVVLIVVGLAIYLLGDR